MKFIAVLLFAIVGSCYCALKCAEHDVECHEKAKYTREENEKGEDQKWKKYLSLIEKALNEYNECEFSNCSCYKLQLETDLEPWKSDGISASLFEKASQVERLSHYQIVDHKLYRNKDSMFPAR